MFTFQATVLKCGVLFGKLFIIYWMLVKSAKCKHNNSKIMSAGPKKHRDMGYEYHYSQHNNPAYEI